MKFLALILFIFSMTFYAQARKPAVEDVFTIITADYEVIPNNKLVPVDFTKKTPKLGKMDSQNTASGWVSVIGLVAMLSLPGLMWFQLTRTNKEDGDVHVESFEHTNVSNLDDYRHKPSNDTDKMAS